MGPGIEGMSRYRKAAKGLIPGPGFLFEAGRGAENPEPTLAWTFSNLRASSRGGAYGIECGETSKTE